VSPADELSEKTERLLRLLQDQGLGGVLLTTQHNFAWLTGGRRSGLDLSVEAGSCALLVTRDGQRRALASRIEMPRVMAEDLAGLDFEAVEHDWAAEASIPGFLASEAARLTGSSALGADTSLAGTRPAEAALTGARARLTVPERERFRALGRDAGEVVGTLCRGLRPGQTESEIARAVTSALATHDIRAVVALVGADERVRRFRHPLPTDAPWHDSVMVVVCARRHGLTASLTRMVTAGPVPGDLAQRTRAAAEVGARLHAATRVGATAGKLFDVVARAYAEVGFPEEEQLHHQGGACGYRTRDWVARPGGAEQVQDSQAFAWNPSITGTKVEETCVLDGDGLEWLTRSPEWPVEEAASEGRVYPAPAVLSLSA
jgi:Xaa-Pro aminopeptidase